MLSEQEPTQKPKLELEPGRTLTVGLDRLYGNSPLLDEEAKRQRGQIADEMYEVMCRLGLNIVDRLSLPTEARPDVATVIRNTLLGHMTDETPTLDIIPRGRKTVKGGRMRNDPLWKYVSPQLTTGEIGYAFATLTTLGRLVRSGYLDTLAGIRGVPDWSLLNGFGDSKGKFMHKAVKKIEVPAK